VVHDRDEAEDIVQNAFLHAYEKIDQLAGERFGPWFLRIVLNAAIKAARRQEKQVSIEAEAATDGQSLEDLLADQQPSPETLVETDELSQVIWQALQRLTPEQRVTVVMKYYLEMSEVEMTAALGHPVSTIKWRLYTARQRMKDLLRPKPPASQPASEQSPYTSEKRE
jgi:RNA polymerase sigma-70 factor (ECF subfamily)